MYFAHQSSLTLLLSLVGEPAHIEAENWRQVRRTQHNPRSVSKFR